MWGDPLLRGHNPGRAWWPVCGRPQQAEGVPFLVGKRDAVGSPGERENLHRDWLKMREGSPSGVDEGLLCKSLLEVVGLRGAESQEP